MNRGWRRGAAALLCAALSGWAQAQGGPRSLEPAIERGRGVQCVADPATMRRSHPELLRHQRDETVHRGVRDPRASLAGCVECHAGRASGSVAAAPGDFCISCHSFAAVRIDCFECHASRPRAAAFVPLVHPRAGSAEAALLAQWRQIAARAPQAR